MTYGGEAQPAELSLANTRVIDFTSSVNGRDYRLNVGIPLLAPPPAGYRIFFVLDGNGYSASAIEAVRWNMNAPDVLVVGIGYPETEAFIAASLVRQGPPRSDDERVLPPFILAYIRERLFDLTLPIGANEFGDMYDFPGAPSDAALTGGLDDFLDTLEQDIKPRIAAIWQIDDSGSALFGHSAGGHAVLHALFTRPAMVRSFIAASASIWLSGRAVLDGEAGFGETIERGEAAPRILVTMGADESSMPRNLPPGFDASGVEKLIRSADMVESARHLVDRLKALRGVPAYEVADYAVFAEQQHGLSVWPAIGRAIDFAFQR